ncbi:MAG: cyclopropane-fatty-acyl-phospholipid synthase family protein [Parvibaculaceae bacterium]|nr:cyclopropane-fatty-acyl-phospholipid synthase family protein [Parvibaculaceae bacterium]
MLAKIALNYFLKKIQYGSLTVTCPDGSYHRATGPHPGPSAHLSFHNLSCLPRLLLKGDLAFAEAYMEGDWSTDTLPELVELGVANLEAFRPNRFLSFLIERSGRMAHIKNANTVEGSKRNISFHYDLGNEFYSAWLDPTMSYSSALFDSDERDMTAAQERKYHKLARSIDLSPGDRLLEIGCGWGGFAEIAARDYGAEVVGLTLSQEQAQFTRDRMEAGGLSSQVDIRLQDYRHVTGKFDKIVSIEMFEAVGEENWPTYFRVLKERLTPGGKAALQIITIDQNIFEKYRQRIDFIQRYIFPGGMLPSKEALAVEFSREGLTLNDSHFFGTSYADTLMQWRQKFTTAWPQIADMGFDQRFKRMWLFYLCYCEGGFRAGRINVGQFTLTNT